MLVFDPVLHVYSDSVTGEVVKSVTQWLNISSPFYTAEGRERGRAVHELCERYLKGARIDNTGRHLECLVYVNSFAKFCKDKKPYALFTECMIFNTINGKKYAGTFDFLAEINGKRYLIDIKTGARQKWHIIQNSAYSMASMQNGEAVNPDHCATLYLTKDGKYTLEKYTGLEILEGIKEFKIKLEA